MTPSITVTPTISPSIDPTQSIDYPSNQNIKVQNDKLSKDENEDWYIERADGSRIYLTGKWKELQVWQDEKGNSYINIANGNRKYLTGSIKGMIAFKESYGNWFAINDMLKKVYYTGPNAI